MALVDQSNWRFEFGAPTQMEQALGTTKKPRILTFGTAFELVQHLSDEKDDDYIPIQSRIQTRIDEDPVAREWKKIRTKLGTLEHFPRYRRNEFDRYHEAARAKHSGRVTVEQQVLADGLEAEINASRIIITAGQVLFHGRADLNLTELTPYPAFVSTSLDPVVARQSAFRRSGLGRANGHPVVYVLTLNRELPALWGQTGNSHEYELLLPARLVVTMVNRYDGANFSVVAAEVVDRI